jgi:hypothetical protein
MKVIKIGSHGFRVEMESGSQFEASWSTVESFLLDEMGVDREELEFAVDTARSMSHDTMHFGVNRMFTHSSSSTRVRNIVEELRAINSLRAELRAVLVENPHDMRALDIQDRIIRLYDTLNVRDLIEALGASDRMAA